MGPTLASFSMSQNLWLPLWISIGLLLCAVPTIQMLPDTRQQTLTDVHVSEDDHENIDESGPLLAEQDPSPSMYANAFENKQGFIHNVLQAIRKMIRLVIGRRNFQFLLSSFFLTSLASSDTKLLVQYISKRYEWTFAQVGLPLIPYQKRKSMLNFSCRLAISSPQKP